MVDQTRLPGYIAGKLTNQLQNAQNAAQREKLMDEIANSQQVEHLKEVVNPDRLSEKMQSVTKNERIQDFVHISPEGREKQQAQETTQTNPQGPGSESNPHPELGALGNLNPEA